MSNAATSFPFPVVGQFEFQPLCVTNQEIQTDPLPLFLITDQKAEITTSTACRNSRPAVWDCHAGRFWDDQETCKCADRVPG